MKFAPDLAAFMFACMFSDRANEVCRIAFLLNESVQPEPLRQAFDDLRLRFPSFFVGLQRTAFRNWLVNTGLGGDVVPAQRVCLPFKLGVQNTLVRAIYEGNWLVFEFAHVVADGGAGVEFAKTLLVRYLELCGEEVDWAGILNLDEPPTPEELRDDYAHHYRKCKGKTPKPPIPFHHDVKREKGYLQITTVQLQLQQLIAAAKTAQVTVTEYLVAAYMLAFYRNDPKAQHSCRPIRITIPISLRRFFNSTSLRNFSLVTDLSLYPREHPNATHADILSDIRGKLATQITPEEIDRLIYTNQSMRQVPIVDFVPNVLLRAGVYAGYMFMGEGTSALSNIGTIVLPPSVAVHVQNTQVAVSTSPRAALQAIAHTYQNHHNVVFTHSTRNTSVIADFAHVLQELGFDVTKETHPV